jgi:hypothetical protein
MMTQEEEKIMYDEMTRLDTENVEAWIASEEARQQEKYLFRYLDEDIEYGAPSITPAMEAACKAHVAHIMNGLELPF